MLKFAILTSRQFARHVILACDIQQFRESRTDSINEVNCFEQSLLLNLI